MAELPHGRGLRRYTGSNIDQSESWASRGRGVSEAGGWSYPSFQGREPSPSLITLEQYVVFSHLPALYEPVELSHARARVTTAQAGEHVRSAIYRAEVREGTRRFIRVPHTDATFEAATTGIKDVSLGGVARLVPGQQYLMASRSSHASVALPGVASDSKDLMPVYTLPGSFSGVFPGEVNINDLTKAHNVNFPWILYISKELKELI